MNVCLDAWAVIAWLDGENPAVEIVRSVIDDRPVMSWLNLAEVYYRLERESDEKRAVETINELRMSLDLELPTERRILESARLKAKHPIALADCFAISTARDNDAVLYTGDPEILKIRDLPCEVRDLRG
jgi:predicted nucleic acid-binding protein